MGNVKSSPTPKRGGEWGAAELQPLPQIELKKHVLSDLPYSRNQLLKSTSG